LNNDPMKSKLSVFKCMNAAAVLATTFLVALGIQASSPAAAAGKNGTTLAASKTLDICEVSPGGNWLYTGEISVWNEGAVDTQGFQILDHLQSKISGPVWTEGPSQIIGAGDVIPAGTTEGTATVYPYSFLYTPLAGDIRNVADLTITNHSGHLNTPFGPSPKATYLGPNPPPPCGNVPAGCTYTRGYWGNKPGVLWPPAYDRNALFYNSGMTWQNILNQPAGGNGYYILGAQFIAATLNAANGAAVPVGVQSILTLANAWFLSVMTPATACPAANSCGTQKTWAGILDDYNNGVYPGGPPHCGDENNN
jgi:hypothetical protein